MAAVALAVLGQAFAQPTIVSVVPTSGATGVSPTAPVVFTFSTAMDTTATTAQFLTAIPSPPYFIIYNTSPAWNAASNILTCTPQPSFASPTQVVWSVTGQDPSGTALSGTTSGGFTTGSGGGGGGSGTNAITTFILEKIAVYHQTSIAQPTLDPAHPFNFLGTTSLASNRSATNITLTLPNGAVSNLMQNPLTPQNWNVPGYSTNSASLDTNFPAGNYTFTVKAVSSNQSVVVSFPASLAFPNAPHLTNFMAAQTVDPTKPFTLYWDPFTGGGASDYVLATVSQAWQTPELGAAGALKGTATSATIPAGTLAAGQTYNASLAFAHPILITNSTYGTAVYRATLTEFQLVTSSGTGGAPVVTNAAWIGGTFTFDLLTSPGQMVTVVSTTNVADALASWPVLITTNPSGTSVHITDPRSATTPAQYYRARNGN